MALVKVYDLQNVEHEMESVDARECVQVLGWSLTPKPAETTEPAEPAEGDEPAKTGEPVKRGRKPKGE